MQILERISVLVVEDEYLLRMDMEDELVRVGYAVLTAANPNEAIEILSTHTDIRLMVTDINMPGTMDGIAITQYVRNRWPPILMIVASGAVAGMDQIPSGIPWFTKPYAHKAIQAKILELLGAA